MGNESAIAIVGMSGRFPGAPTLAEFWQNLKNGVESIRTLTDAELLAAGVSQEELSNEDYVKRGAILENIDLFDAAFFGFSKKDAAIMDPQHRIFLECAWEAFENAGHAPQNFEGSIGVYAGSGMNSYMIHNLLTNHKLVQGAGLFLIRQTGNDKDVLATRVSYELDLRGPSINVQTACSTSLVAVHLACQSLLNQECDMALAGGVTIEFPHGRGYVYREGEILSRDGHCRAFDADSTGTVFSSGAGVVVLRRLEDAIADHDTIHAVILGSAINNDGARKAGFLAPSVDGQAEVITEALHVSGVEPGDIAYVETHGTGTKVGDPIEIKALMQVYRQPGLARSSCAIGSLKTNIGHLDTAAGVAGLIKTVLALKHRQIPPSLHFNKENPLIDFASGPFNVNAKLSEWKPRNGTRRAAITSLGIGGTNAHLVLEEAPPIAEEKEQHGQKPYQLLVMSAKTSSALDQMSRNLGDYLRENPEANLKDIAYTCQVGRKAMAFRRAVVAATSEEATTLLDNLESNRMLTGQAPPKAPGIVFMFSGQGSQHIQMGRQLYETELTFRAQFDLCAERLAPELGLDLRTLLFQSEQESAAAAEKLARTCFTQPALFSIEFAMSKWWMEHGVHPAAMIGHSIGEYVAACLAGVFSLEDALRLTAIRGRLMDQMPRGSMLAVSAKPELLSIPQDLSLAAVNGPEQCVVSGPSETIQEYAKNLEHDGILCHVLHTSHAFHSAMMDPILESFAAEMAKVTRYAPKLPYISNLTGTWITPEEATSPEYWAKHLRNAVQFSSGMSELFLEPSLVFLEIGPGQVLTSLARRHPGRPKSSRVFSSMRHPQEKVSDAAVLLNATGQLWIAGCSIDWNALHDGDRPRRIPVPTYPFERQRYWIEPSTVSAAARTTSAAAVTSSEEVVSAESWFHHRVWKQVPLGSSTETDKTCWLIFIDEAGLGAEISSQLKAAGQEVVQVAMGTKYQRTGPGKYLIRPNVRDDYDHLLGNVDEREQLPTKILHLWPVMKADQKLDRTLDSSFYSLLYLAQALGDQGLEKVDITSVSNGLQSLSGEKVNVPARAVSFGPVRVIPKEFPAISCRSVDVDWKLGNMKTVARQLIVECSSPAVSTCVLWRQSERWVESFEPTSVRPRTMGSRLKNRGVYWITGGMGGIGLVIAEHLARTVHARLVLIGRRPLPPASEWDDLLKQAEKAGSAHDTIRKIRQIESLGGEVLTLAADVTDPKQMKDAFELAQKRFGQLNGVIHAAGLIEDGPLQIKSKESADRVLAPKVQGTLVLQDLLRSSDLDFWLLFSSVSAITPPPGQIDYAAANAFLDAFALSETGQPITALNWTLWTDVGMANTASINHPVVGRRLVQTPSEVVYSTRLSCEEDWMVGEHRLKTGESLVPGTGYLQLTAAAITRDRFEPGVQFEDVFFLAPLTVRSGEKKELRVRLRRQRSGYRFSILSQEKEWIEFASGQISRNQQTIPASQKIDEIRARCSSRRIDFDEEHRTRQEKFFDFGPRWQNLKCLHIGDREALAELQLRQDFTSDLDTWQLHPALLDLATGSSLYLIKGYDDTDAMYLPLSYKRIVFYRPITGKVYSHIRSLQENATKREIATFDITLLEETGQVLAEIHEFSLRRMSTSAESLTPTKRRASEASHEPAEILADFGITSDFGIEALDQVLSGDLSPNLIIHRGRLADKVAVPQASSGSENTAKIDSKVETVLAEWWQELLGVEQVGLDDDFFDLGGHSLIAVRLFTKIKKTFRVDLALSTLFEARTIRQLANLVRQVGTSTAGGVPETDTPTIVPIRSQGSRLPLFLISGLGGGVIKFHALARSLGEDQPVYALQPQGIDGRKSFLTRVEDMAAYYIGQIKKIQPLGPYCLAGYSFGGYVVFEMAQQLHAAGEKVVLVGFLDTIEYQYRERLRGSSGTRWQRWEMRINRLKKGGRSYVHEAVKSFVERMAYGIFGKLDRPLPQRFSTLPNVNGFAMSQYRPTVYPGQLVIFRSVNREEIFENDELLGWGGLAEGGIEVFDITGTHLEMLYEPNVRVLAEKLRSCLERAQSHAHSEHPGPASEALVSG
jgi:acyl transferase domain-containing protein/thioesterase domain-containing protein/acyl carrier protein